MGELNEFLRIQIFNDYWILVILVMAVVCAIICSYYARENNDDEDYIGLGLFLGAVLAVLLIMYPLILVVVLVILFLWVNIIIYKDSVEKDG